MAAVTAVQKRDETGEWPMDCHLFDGWDTGKCCVVCHADAKELGMEPDQKIHDNGRIYYVCCNLSEWYPDEN